MDTNHQDARPVVLWIVVATIAVHFIEEYTMNFPAWVFRVSSMPLTSEDFHLVNACVALYAIACAVAGWRLPAFSLTSAALVGFNGLFHTAAFFCGGYSPGALTGLLLFMPASLAAYQTARRDGLLSTRVLVISLAIGAVWHVYLAVIFYLKYFPPATP